MLVVIPCCILDIVEILFNKNIERIQKFVVNTLKCPFFLNWN